MWINAKKGAPNTDRVVKIYNKGWYTANLRLLYEQQVGVIKQSVIQTGSITAGQDYGFYIPFSVNFDGATGVTLIVNAVAGVQVLETRIRGNPECFHIWGMG